MGKFVMPATLSQTVAIGLSQLSQSGTTLRQCDSCPYPFRDRAPTVALSREGFWRENQSVANTLPRYPPGGTSKPWEVRRGHRRCPFIRNRTAPVQKLGF